MGTPFAGRRDGRTRGAICMVTEMELGGDIRGARGEHMDPIDSVQPDGPLTAEQVFRDYAPRVYNLARRMLGNAADAEDVTQDVLLQVVRKLDTFRGESAFPTWLHRVTVNAALAARRKRARRDEGRVADPLAGFTEDGQHSRSEEHTSELQSRQYLVCRLL